MIPLVWVRIHPRDNPDCMAVRDAFLAAHPHPYSELTATWNPSDERRHHQLWDGFRVAALLTGAPRCVYGLRAEESAGRRQRMRTSGVSSLNTCAPIGTWSARDVFAYLHHHRLPVHPAYACTLGGRLDRDFIRVGSIGGDKGREHGRAEWEALYYPETVNSLRVYRQ